MGGVVPVVNIQGVNPGSLVLDGKTLGDIFIGKVKNWNDPAIKTLNPSVNLPNQAIAVVHRSDGSGTTFLFTDYLSKVNPDWQSKVGANASVEWPVGIGAKGNEGVAGNVGQTRGSIGYVEYAYAKQNKLAHANMTNKDGKTVIPEIKAFQAAAAGAGLGRGVRCSGGLRHHRGPGRRHPARTHPAADRAVLPGRRRPITRGRWHRPGFGHRQAHRQPPSRATAHRKRAGAGQRLRGLSAGPRRAALAQIG
jgi:ABC-type phosphate transport system substrate-binding protein